MKKDGWHWLYSGLCCFLPSKCGCLLHLILQITGEEIQVHFPWIHFPSTLWHTRTYWVRYCSFHTSICNSFGPMPELYFHPACLQFQNTAEWVYKSFPTKSSRTRSESIVKWYSPVRYPLLSMPLLSTWIGRAWFLHLSEQLLLITSEQFLSSKTIYNSQPKLFLFKRKKKPQGVAPPWGFALRPMDTTAFLC